VGSTAAPGQRTLMLYLTPPAAPGNCQRCAGALIILLHQHDQPSPSTCEFTSVIKMNNGHPAH